MAQEKFGIDPSDIHFYAGLETDSKSLTSSLTMEVKGATVSEEGHEEYGNIFIDAENIGDALDLNETLGHVRTDDLANTNTVKLGTQQSHSVGGADVEYNNACLYANICNSRDQAEADMLSLWRSDDPEKQAEGERIYSALQEYDQLQREDVGAFFDRVGEEGIKGAIGSMLEESYEGLKAVADNPALLKEGLQEVEDDLTGKNGEARQMLAWDNLNQSLKTAAITLPVSGGLAGSVKTLDNLSEAARDNSVNKVPGAKVKDVSQSGEIDFYEGVDNKNSGPLVDYVKLSNQTNLPPETLESIIMALKGSRPESSEYMTKTQIDQHLAKFDEGVIRFTSKSGIEDCRRKPGSIKRLLRRE
ncbi:hypothetical protein CWI84_09570 [Idiomarina tyrosinivorans]|uniref:Uncharacterized protein n=1 Tax=Idiomarina tyrosinivorans TaxID=1445662 RepID=A0A432ZPP1_9GAMM|nr:hypothetical protein [Idiomarina tyrosinivorans]RUO79864.1 hypothetical protein CWI84_09570 [Idiomarina tyrosinivorans]